MTVKQYFVQYESSRPYVTEVTVVGSGTHTIEVPHKSKPGATVHLNRNTRNHGYFDTWVEAHDALKARASHRLLEARRILQLAQAYEGAVKGLKPPQEK